jgi:glycosyltransferase involved in cell wall biosynthesis
MYRDEAYDVVRDYMDAADIFVHGCTEHAEGDTVEALSQMLLLAMARGLPVISTTHGNVAQFIEPGKTGFVVDSGNSRAMAEAIVRLTKNRELRRLMGLQAFAGAQQAYSFEVERGALRALLGLV